MLLKLQDFSPAWVLARRTRSALLRHTYNSRQIGRALKSRRKSLFMTTHNSVRRRLTSGLLLMPTHGAYQKEVKVP